MFIYRPQTKFWARYTVFTPVCSQGGPSLLPRPMFLLGGFCLWSHVPSGGSPSWGSLSGGDPCLGGLCRGGCLCLEGLSQGDSPYGEQRAVRILLECILVTNVLLQIFYLCNFHELARSNSSSCTLCDFWLKLKMQLIGALCCGLASDLNWFELKAKRLASD